MPLEIMWTDAEEIGIQLQEKFPELDPLTLHPYLYKPKPDGTYSLASEGTPTLGRIELVYHRPKKAKP